MGVILHRGPIIFLEVVRRRVDLYHRLFLLLEGLPQLRADFDLRVQRFGLLVVVLLEELLELQGFRLGG